MLLFLTGFLSAATGLVLYDYAFGKRVVDRFLLSVGQSLYQINRFNLDETEHLRLNQRLALKVLQSAFILALGMALLIGLSGLPFLLIPSALYSTREFWILTVSGALLPGACYLFLRRQRKDSEYSSAKQLFYYTVLGVPSVGRCLARLQQPTLRKSRPPGSALIVTGLARAGTTALLNLLYTHPQFWSFTYRHMPLLAAPKLWERFNRGESVERERSHQDGLVVGLDSPEAFDEYFWRIILRERYYSPGQLRVHEVTDAEIAEYERCIAPCLNFGSVYLSKNNNFLLRLTSFLQQRACYTIVLVYRDPVSHALSLQHQHVLQSEHQQKTPFARDYMDLLGHHEFGTGRREFLFHPDSPGFEFEDPLDVNYWVERWIEYYTYALRQNGSNLHFVSNQQIATEPARVVEFLINRLKLDASISLKGQPHSRSANSDTKKVVLSPTLVEQAEDIYNKLNERAGAMCDCRGSAGTGIGTVGR